VGRTGMRIEQWSTVLHDFIEARRNTPFSWGGSDCCLFAADAVQAITEQDFAAAWRGKYDDAREAHALIADAGGVDNMIPLDEIEPNYAQRGDVAMIDMDGRDVLAIHLGDIVAGQGVDGLVFFSPALVKRAWKSRA
jgi:hypothetical protein